MKITDIRTRLLRLPEPSLSGDNLQDLLIVEVLTDQGITGIGEVHTNPLAARAIIDYSGYHTSSRGLREILVGENPLEIARLWDKMYSLTQSYGRRGLLINTIGGIDIALWDLLGKHLRAPVYRLLGFGRRTSIPAYASALAPPDIEETINQSKKFADAGFHGLKLGWGSLGHNLGEDAERVRRVRAALGSEVEIMLDLGMPLRREDALWLGRALADDRVYFLEEPLAPDDFDGWRMLVTHSPTPIATGEKETTRHGFADLIDRGGLRIIQPDIARAGGITESLRIAAYAESRGIRVIPHCWSSDILLAATMHVITTLADCPFIEFNVMDQPLRTKLARNPIRPQAGIVFVPQEPGLGIELDEATISKYEVH
jgi:L-rhamnonate dehydratase